MNMQTKLQRRTLLPAARRTVTGALCASAFFTAATVSSPSVQAQEAARYPAGVAYRGINRAGLEFEVGWWGWKGAGFYEHESLRPDLELGHYAAKGFNVVRLPIAWERIQHELNAKIDEDYAKLIDSYVEEAQRRRMSIVIDLHNYATYSVDAYSPSFKRHILGDGTLAFPHLADVWTQLADRYKNKPNVILGLMNEPHDQEPNPAKPAEPLTPPMRSTEWFDGIQTVIDAIRASGSKHLILVPNSFGSDADHWSEWSRPGSKLDSDAAVRITDSADNIAFDLHQYPNPKKAPLLSNLIEPVTTWAKAQNPKRRLFLSELGVLANAPDGKNLISGDPQEKDVSKRGVLGFMEANSDVWIGWTPWDLNDEKGEDFRLTNDGSEMPAAPRHTVDLPPMAWYEPFLDPAALQGGDKPSEPTMPGNGSAENVYTDALMTGWADWSFNLGSSAQVNSPAHGTSAYEVTFGQFSGFKLAHATGGVEQPLDAGNYSAVVFHLRPKAASPTLETLSFQFENGSDSVLISQFATLVPGEWTEVRIPVSAANSSGAPFVTIQLNDAANSTIGIDDIWLERKSSALAPAEH